MVLSPAPGQRISLCYLSVLVAVCIGLGLRQARLSAAGATVSVEHGVYMPIAAKAVPTPTLTPTATPLPPMLQVRVLGEDTCSSFRGGSREDPNGEYVCLRNDDPRPADMTGWLVEDASRHRYIFPVFVLRPGTTVRLHSGAGEDTPTDLHWAGGLVWNNDHDTVHVYDAFGRLVSRYVY
jgi:competence protein ComEC